MHQTTYSTARLVVSTASKTQRRLEGGLVQQRLLEAGGKTGSFQQSFQL